MDNNNILDAIEKELNQKDLLSPNKNIKEEFDKHFYKIQVSINNIKTLENDENFSIENFECLDNYFIAINNLMQILDNSFPKIFKFNTDLYNENNELKHKEIFKKEDEIEYLLSEISKFEEIFKSKDEMIIDKSIQISNLEKNNSYLIEEIEKKAESVLQLKDIINKQSNKICSVKKLENLLNKFIDFKKEFVFLKENISKYLNTDFLKHINEKFINKTTNNLDLIDNKEFQSPSSHKRETPSFADKDLFRNFSYKKDLTLERSQNLSEILKNVDKTLITFRNCKENHYSLCKLLKKSVNELMNNIESSFFKIFYNSIIHSLEEHFEMAENYQNLLLELHEKIDGFIKDESPKSNTESLDEKQFQQFLDNQPKFRRVDKFGNLVEENSEIQKKFEDNFKLYENKELRKKSEDELVYFNDEN